MRKNTFHPIVATFCLLALSAGLAFGQSQTNETVRVLEVKASDALNKQVAADANTAKLAFVLDSLENNINQGIDNTHRFTVLSRNLKSGQVEGALGDNESPLAAKYILETKVTEFEYDRTNIPIAETGQFTAQCTIRLAGSAEFKKPNGLKSNANFEVSTNAGALLNPNSPLSKKMGDDLLRTAAHEAANQIVSQVVSK